MSETTNSEVVNKAINAVKICLELPLDQRRVYLEILGHASTKFMRAIGGDDYVRGWLEAALAELDQPPMIEIKKLN